MKTINLWPYGKEYITTSVKKIALLVTYLIHYVGAGHCPIHIIVQSWVYRNPNAFHLVQVYLCSGDDAGKINGIAN